MWPRWTSRFVAFLTAIAWIGAMIVAEAPPALSTTPGGNGVVAAARNGTIVYLDPIDGSKVGPVASPLFQQDPSWSATGDRIAFGLGGEITVARADGTGVKKLAFAGTAGSWDASISWHPDGSRLIFVTSSDWLQTIPVMGGEDPVTLATGVFGASYAPDGQSIVIARSDLEIIGSGGGPATTLLSLDGAQRAPDWSPDGSKIAFQSRGPDGWDIWIVDADGSNATVLTPDPANDTDPTWAPDGTGILFKSARDGGGLFMVPVGGGEATPLPASDGLARPAWQPEIVGLRASRSTIDPGSTVRLDVRLDAPLETPVVTLERRRVGEDWTPFAQVDVGDSGESSLTLSNVNSTTRFRAGWAGDSTHPPITSLTVEVAVRAIVRGSMRKYLRIDGRYALYAPGRYAWYRARVLPDHGGSRVCFRLHHLRGSWHEIGFDCFRLRSDSTASVFTGPFPVGTRLRIRAEFADRDHVPDNAAWSYFRYVR